MFEFRFIWQFFSFFFFNFISFFFYISLIIEGKHYIWVNRNSTESATVSGAHIQQVLENNLISHVERLKKICEA